MAILNWKPIETAPMDGRSLVVKEGDTVHTCIPKKFSDKWEYLRIEEGFDGIKHTHTFSITPTHWLSLD